jgi:hypothetical protein
MPTLQGMWIRQNPDCPDIPKFRLVFDWPSVFQEPLRSESECPCFTIPFMVAPLAIHHEQYAPESLEYELSCRSRINAVVIGPTTSNSDG